MTDIKEIIRVLARFDGMKELTEEEMWEEACEVWKEQPQRQVFHMGFMAHLHNGEFICKRSFPNYDDLNEIRRLEEKLYNTNYKKWLDYHDNVGSILFPAPKNRNDWECEAFLYASKEVRLEALYQTLK